MLHLENSKFDVLGDILAISPSTLDSLNMEETWVCLFNCSHCLLSCADDADSWIFRPGFFLNSVEPY